MSTITTTLNRAYAWPSSSTAAIAAAAPTVARRVAAVLREWLQRSRTRAEMAGLDDHLLRDIGLTRGQLLAEVRKPCWQV